MKIQRMLQLALTSFVAQGVSIISQLLVPPLFFRSFAHGVEVYGEWIALSASINYLGTLNYGIQTYANNQMSILYNRGQFEDAKRVQANALRLLLLLVLAFVVIGSLVFYVPVGPWLKLKHVSAQDASLTLYVLIIQMALVMMSSLLTGSYLAVGQLHRGNYWGGGQRLFGVLLLAFGVSLHSSFPTLATIQLLAMIPFIFLIAIDLRRTAPLLLPSLRYGSWGQTTALLKPSGHFGLIAFGGFLTWQGPVIIIQRMLGPTSVALFVLVRVVFQMSRQVLLVASTMISQDITILVGQRSWSSLRRLYELSEKLLLLLIPAVSVGSLLLCPFLFTVWLHKRAFYDPSLCTLMAIVSAVLGIKEHKTQFQSSSNEHESLSIIVLGGYLLMLLVSLPVMQWFGLTGFMVVWIAWEIIQTAFVLRLNSRLFPADTGFSAKPVIRLSLFMVVAFAIAVFPAYQSTKWSLSIDVLVAVGFTGILAGASYFTFGLSELRGLLIAKWQRRFATAISV